MSIDKETIKHISKLARISLDDKKIDNLSKDLSSIIKFIEKLSKLNTDDIKPLTSIIEASLKFRKDKILDGKIRDQILKNSPEKNEEFFVVPKVVE
jgi:aspartyl-tRNA(Asn)/glutamyl-tRNA(Gln) amidotransferase subunit C